MRPGAGQGLGSWPSGLGPGPLMQVHIKASFDASPVTSQLHWTRLDVTGLVPLHAETKKVEVLRLFRRVTHTPHRSGVGKDENEIEMRIT